MLLLTTTLGLEGAVSREVKNLGYKIQDSLTGRVLIDAGYHDIPFFNINIRSAERILYVVGMFKAQNFNELYENIKSLDFSFMPKKPFVRVAKVKTVNSKLHSVRSIQSISMKALVDKFKYVDGNVPYIFHIYARSDNFIVAVDTTGKNGLHLRGYRKKYSRAPLRETIAAALLILSRYTGKLPFYDPFCGSGTIPVEAYLIAKNIPPNLKRSFTSENWPDLGKIYRFERKKAADVIKGSKPEIFCSDIDDEILAVCKENTERAGASVKVFKRDFKQARAWTDVGTIVSNPPYGKRIEDSVWKDMNVLFNSFPGWSINLISPKRNIQKLMKVSPDKTTPFLNSGVKVYFLQFFKRCKAN
ncbi:MAG: methyltransferase [Thermotogaceae bacterium]|nr:methyltransferase [Thermotogaceae bacterium]